MASSLTKDMDVDPKFPSWGGDWLAFADYSLRVELRADSTKDEDLPHLGPRLANNLVGRAFESLGDVDRQKLKKADGWQYLLGHLEKTRGKTKIDLLGDSFTEFFLKKDAFRKDGEEMNDYEARFRTLVRKMEKAPQQVGSESKIPSEFLLNVFMRLEPTDMANVRGAASSYKLEDVMKTLHTMWSGASLSQRDAELKRRRQGNGNYLCEPGTEEAEIYQQGMEMSTEPDEETEELESAAGWYQSARAAFLEEPEDNEVLANFRDARKALDKARTSRGFYPVANPNQAKGNGARGPWRSGGIGKGNPDHSDKTCMRCGKKGHIARACPQRPTYGGKGKGQSGSVHFIGYHLTDGNVSQEFVSNEEMCSTENSGEYVTTKSGKHETLWSMRRTWTSTTWKRFVLKTTIRFRTRQPCVWQHGARMKTRRPGRERLPLCRIKSGVKRS